MTAPCANCSEKETGLPHPAHKGRCGMPTGHLGVVSCYCRKYKPLSETKVSNEPWHPTEEQLLDLIHQERPIPEADENGDVHCLRLWPLADCQYVHGHYGGCSPR